ncbi:hypothetical protein GO755_10615 [Spirosoma sp. HMF4905]|uniref:Uncharacterized protein n=1 Tax=Spirosoma arboris TaxID=2682092 RepID=A0A7K1SAC2_9BACT|nr:hypothetical protein [Spirosoma arboris]MVM30486.1 hypothetical protein [Spirosoma arboris]
MAIVTTASTKDYTLLQTMIAPLQQSLGIFVADSGTLPTSSCRRSTSSFQC